MVMLSAGQESVLFKKPTQATHRRFVRLMQACVVCGVLGVCLPAKASIFEPLLKILLPSYKNIHSPSVSDTTHQADDEENQYIDDGTEGAYLPNEHYGKQQSSAQLPNGIFDELLSADDVLPVLDKPDLYAVLSAEFFADRGNIEQALTLYKAESFKKNATAVFERALALSIEYESAQDSLAFATAWQSKNTDHIPAWFYVAHLALKAGDYQQAVQTLALILEYDPTADLTQILTGIFPATPQDQRALFAALQEVGDDNPSVSVLRAGLLMRLQEYAPALLHVDKALLSEPENLAFITLKIDILKASGQTQDLWRFLHEKRQQLPTQKELYLYEIRHLLAQANLAQAWELLLVAKEKTADPEIKLLTALVGLDIGQYDIAIEVLSHLVVQPEYASRAHYYLGIGYERQGQFEQARHHYEKVTDYEHVLDARTKVVGFYLSDNDSERAMATLVRLREDYEIYATDSYIYQAEILMRQGNKQQAQNLLMAANRENPDDDRLLFASFKVLENELSFEDKRLAIDQLIEINPYNLEYQLADAKLRLSYNPNDSYAISVAKDISELGISDPNYDSQLQLEALLVLANHALEQKNYTQVIEYLQVPYEVAPTLELGIALLKAYQGLGNNEQVMGLLQQLQARFGLGGGQADDSGQIY